MKRITINALIDIGYLITFIPSLVSGLVLHLVFPEGGGRGKRLDTVPGDHRKTSVKRSSSLPFELHSGTHFLHGTIPRKDYF